MNTTRLPARPGRHAARAAAPILALVASSAIAGAVAASFPEPPSLAGRLVYSRAEAFQWNLFTSDADGDNESRLTTVKSVNAKGDDQPRWSPDGREIVFSTFSKNGETAFIWRVPFGGGTPTPVVTAVADDAGYPAWGPGDGAVVYAGRHEGGGPSQLDLKVWAEEGAYTLAVTGGIDEREPDYSRAAGRIAYAAKHVDTGNPYWTIRTMADDGSDDRELFASPGVTARHPRWSPDGTQVAFVTYFDEDGFGKGTLWVRDVENGTLTEVLRGVANPVSWSPDGAWFLVYNTLQQGLEHPSAATPTRSPPGTQLLGLYLLRIEDRTLFRLKAAAGGDGANGSGYEWGQVADWTAGTLTPTPVASDTPTATATVPSATPEPGTPSPTATGTAVPGTTTPTATPTLTATATAPAPPASAYLPAAYLEFDVRPLGRHRSGGR